MEGVGDEFNDFQKNVVNGELGDESKDSEKKRKMNEGAEKSDFSGKVKADDEGLDQRERELERRFQQRERDMRERMEEEFQARQEDLQWRMKEEWKKLEESEEIKDQMKDLKGANDDLRRQLTSMMELQGQWMKNMGDEKSKKKKTEVFSLDDDEEEEAQEIVRWSGGTLQLPKLEYGHQDNAMECGDWMAKIAVTMRDLSKNSHIWWDKIVKDAEEAYQRYMKASPIVKLEVETELEDERKYLRLRSKATSILLEAIPKDISSEAVAAREIHPAQLLYAIMKKFQPGGLGERSQL